MDGNEVKMLFLSQEDMIEAGVLDMPKCIEVMEDAFKLVEKGDYLFGGPGGDEHGVRIVFPKTARGPRMPVAGPDRRFMAMVGYVGGEFNVCGEKWYGSNVANRERGLPRSILTVMLNDVETGAPIALMEGNLISAMRTGAIPGVGAKYLARKDAEVVGIIGAGVISKPCLMSIAETLPNIKQVKVFDILKSQSETFSREMKEKLNLNVYPVDSLEEAVRNSDVVNLATAGPKPPFVKTEWLKEGLYVALPGVAYHFEDDFYLMSRVVVDNWKIHRGFRREFNALPAELQGVDRVYHEEIHILAEAGRIKVEELGPMISGKRPGRINDKERIVLATGGLPIEDITWGYTVYKEALKKGLGQELSLWKKPYVV